MAPSRPEDRLLATYRTAFPSSVGNAAAMDRAKVHPERAALSRRRLVAGGFLEQVGPFHYRATPPPAGTERVAWTKEPLRGGCTYPHLAHGVTT